MAKLLSCRLCFIDFARIELADGSIALVCSDCDVIGVEHEIKHGGPVWVAGLSSPQRRPRRSA